jgi:hypothetical protein
MFNSNHSLADRDLATWLTSVRTELGYSVEAMSVLTGLATAEIDDVESGLAIPVASAARLRAALGKLRR